MKDIIYDITAFTWDKDAKCFFGDEKELWATNEYFAFPFPSGRQQFYIHNKKTDTSKRFRYADEFNVEFAKQYIFMSEDGITCMVKIYPEIIKNN
jgi:hypothetical protein